jgi:hypothetical protein
MTLLFSRGAACTTAKAAIAAKSRVLMDRLQVDCGMIVPPHAGSKNFGRNFGTTAPGPAIPRVWGPLESLGAVAAPRDSRGPPPSLKFS